MMNNSLLFGCIAFLILASTVLSFEVQGNEKSQDKEQVLQTKEVYGTVRDSVGPIPGVSVTIKNTTTGTTTDLNGKYILEVPDDPNTTLVFSMVGFDPQEIVIGNQTSIDVTLQVSSTQLDEAVVVRSEEHTSELQSRENLVCRLLLEKKNI